MRVGCGSREEALCARRHKQNFVYFRDSVSPYSCIIDWVQMRIEEALWRKAEACSCIALIFHDMVYGCISNQFHALIIIVCLSKCKQLQVITATDRSKMQFNWNNEEFNNNIDGIN